MIILKNAIDKSWEWILPGLNKGLLEKLNREVLPNISYQPKTPDIFNVFKMPLNKIKVVILGQDPYPTPGVAVGRAFAVSKSNNIPISLKIIQQEIIKEFSNKNNKSIIEELEPFQYEYNADNFSEWKTLDHWTEQGVFLLNTALTVETGKAGSHLKYWEEFTNTLIKYISLHNTCIWIIWGKKAQRFIPYINNPFRVKGYDKETIENIPSNNWNYILTAPHPAAEAYSGGNAGFFNCNHFYHTNKILKKLNKSQINW